MKIRHAITLAPVAAVLFLAACATPIDESAPEIAATRAAIESARVAGAQELAPVELTQAREKFDRAQVAARDGNNVQARRLAEEALADAQLAQAKSSAARAMATVNEIDKNLQALREESARPAAPSTTPQPAK